MDLHQCLAWIPHLWCQLVGSFLVSKKEVIVRPLPDDVIIDILSRLPADCVLECQSVCRQWRVLTSSPHFAELHLKRATTPSLFLQDINFRNLYDNKLDMFVFDEEAGNKDKRIAKIRTSTKHVMKKQWPMTMGSCNGLLLFEGVVPQFFFIFNPIRWENIITVKVPFLPGQICGIYFHQLTGEYKLIYMHIQPNNYFKYLICALGEKIWRQVASLYYRPQMDYSNAITLNGSLHWMTRTPPCRYSIMVFSTEKENFQFMPHPGNTCRSIILDHNEMKLLEMKKRLCLCYYSRCDKLIDIWVLEDYASWDWIRRYKINLDWDVKRYPMRSKLWRPLFAGHEVKVLSIQKGELLVAWQDRGLFWYNLELNTIRKVQEKDMKMPASCSYFCRSTVYTKTLVNLSHIS